MSVKKVSHGSIFELEELNEALSYYLQCNAGMVDETYPESITTNL